MQHDTQLYKSDTHPGKDFALEKAVHGGEYLLSSSEIINMDDFHYV